jgi:2-methylisocitrate lyase-like PEP mutase family enzyme
MSSNFADARARFRALHRQGCFVLPNPWDAGSALRLKALGFQALASSSAAAAWALGRGDGEISLDQAIDHLAMLCAATDLPVNADFEAGFSGDAAGVGESVRRAIGAGVAGLSIEDRPAGRVQALYPLDEALARLRAARAAIDASGEDVILVARSEGFLVGRTDLGETISRLQAYAEVGADCLYAPGVRELPAIREIVAAVAPKPVNVLLSTTDASVAELAEAGVRRVSVGGALAAQAWKAFDAAAGMLASEGRLPPR